MKKTAKENAQKSFEEKGTKLAKESAAKKKAMKEQETKEGAKKAAQEQAGKESATKETRQKAAERATKENTQKERARKEQTTKESARKRARQERSTKKAQCQCVTCDGLLTHSGSCAAGGSELAQKRACIHRPGCYSSNDVICNCRHTARCQCYKCDGTLCKPPGCKMRYHTCAAGRFKQSACKIKTGCYSSDNQFGCSC